MNCIINGEKVEYCHIEQDETGNTVVEYSKKFNVATAHMGEIMKRLCEANLHAVVTHYPVKYKIVVILLDKIEDVHPVLNALSIPYGCYEVNKEDAIITVDIPVINKML